MQRTIVNNYIFGTTRNLLLGAGAYYAIHNNKYEHLPIIIFFPSIYAGYHMYENKEAIIRFLKNIRRD